MARRPVAVGMDVGFRKTGLSAIELKEHDDELIDATTIYTEKAASGSAAFKDVESIWTLLDGIIPFLVKHKPVAIFCEIPHGGAQGARANRCMGIATGVAVTLTRWQNIPFELYEPGQVEELMGIKLKPGDLERLGLPKKGGTAFKKQRMMELVSREWPLFDGWPKRKAEAEDAIDSAVAFLAGRRNNKLYAKVKEKACQSSLV